jgi:hypothetical protein
MKTTVAFPGSGFGSEEWDLSSVTLKLTFSGPQAEEEFWANADAAKRKAIRTIFTKVVFLGCSCTASKFRRRSTLTRVKLDGFQMVIAELEVE